MKDYNRVEPMSIYGENATRIVNVSDEVINLIRADVIDEVVKKLEERKALNEKLIGYESENGTIKNIIAIDVLNDAIDEITKHDETTKPDDLSDDICKWSVRNACYTGSIKKHYNTLPTPIVRTFRYCPYCGKKIKLLVDKNNMYLVENNNTKAEIIEVDQIE